ncbi:polysaccharide deacetylase family protein [Metallibacterium sp.]|uniref:polysaccharide deacetylase family protein n=1 Tax=Metallibacterium sp. TaxID=2940281 RepID=UPI002605DECD|nr:polysaccharide deacetylase family protein [Metallibacterium sp.]
MTMSLKKKLLLGVLPDRVLQTRGPRRGNACYLSFDDGPHPEHTPRLLDLLAAHGVHASFFVVGKLAEAQPHLVERIVVEGHTLGNHSYNHRGFVSLSLAEQVAEIRRADELLSAFDQRPLHRVRPPQGHLTVPLLLHFMRARRSIAYWSYDSLDYQPQSADELTDRLRRLPPTAGDIVLMHDDNARAATALGELLPVWRSEGRVFHALRADAG